jgi:hypothetical protein
VLIMPFLGAHTYQGDTGKGSSAGLRLGTMVGGRIGEMFSINGEFGIDGLNPDNVPTGVDVTAVSVDVTLSPLVHVRTGAIELVAGPKLGFWGARSEAKSSASGATASASGNGNLIGLNAGLFANVSNGMAIGGLLSFDVRFPGHFCFQNPGMAEMCGDATGSAAKVLGITGAALF